MVSTVDGGVAAVGEVGVDVGWGDAVLAGDEVGWDGAAFDEASGGVDGHVEDGGEMPQGEEGMVEDGHRRHQMRKAMRARPRVARMSPRIAAQVGQWWCMVRPFPGER
jgi:hypothetical protein